MAGHDCRVELDLGALLRGLAGGLALFLLGMELVTASLTAAAGDGLRRTLALIGRSRWLGALAGAVVTAVIQSSSITTVLVVGFVSAGFLNLRGAIPLILGANVGSTITAQVVAVDVTEQALLLVALGFVLRAGLGRSRRAEYGGAVLGLGLILLGLRFMADGVEPLRDVEAFLDLMTATDRPLVGLAVGAGFTALVQSSSATTGVAVVLAGQGLVSLPMGIALVLGANVGTCVTAVIASVGKSTEARQAAAVHVVFNLLGVLVWIGFVDQLAALVQQISPAPGELATAQQLANAHTVFNVATSVVFLAAAGPMARLVERIVRYRPEPGDPPAAVPRYLDQGVLGSPVVAMELVRRELRRVARRVNDMGASLLSGDPQRRMAAAGVDDEVDALHDQIVGYLGDLAVGPLSEAQHRELTGLLEVVNELEQLGDAAQAQLVRRQPPGAASVAVTPGLVELHRTVMAWLGEATEAVADRDGRRAELVVSSKGDVNDAIGEMAGSLAQGLADVGPIDVAEYGRAIEVLGTIRRFHQGARRVARTVYPPAPRETASITPEE